MKIAVNTRLLLSGKLEGIGCFTQETFSRIVRQHPEHEFHFLFDRPYSKEFLFAKNVIPHIVPPPARHPLLYTCWYDVMVPAILHRIKPVLFISPDGHASLKTRIPQLTVIHDINFEHYPESVPPVYSRYFKKRTPQYAEKSRRIVTVSNFCREDIASHYNIPKEKIDVVYNGANELFQPLSQSEKDDVRQQYTSGAAYFIFVGSIHPRKNLQRLLPAFYQYKKATGATTRLLVVGEPYWMNHEMKRATAEIQYPESVIFMGRRHTEELRRLIGGALALVYPSYFEGFGIPIVEGFQSGVPVITSPVSALAETAGHAAFFCDPFSVDSIADALKQVASDETLRQSLIEKGFQRASLFHWDHSAEALWTSILKTISNA